MMVYILLGNQKGICMEDLKRNIALRIILFIVICLTATYLIGIAGLKNVGLDHPLHKISMVIPGITVIGLYIFKFKKPIFRNSDLGLNLEGFKYWIIAPIGITMLSLTCYGISFIINPELLKSKEDIIHSLTKSGFYWGNIGLGLTAISFINATSGNLVSIPIYLGEELGWRAFMQAQLLKILNPQMAFLLGGVIWGSWHLLLIFQSPVYPDNSILSIMMIIIICIPLGIIFQYLYVRSNSIFVAALAHGALNRSIMTSSYFLSDVKPETLYYGPTGLIGILVFGTAAFLLYKRIDWQNISYN